MNHRHLASTAFAGLLLSALAPASAAPPTPWQEVSYFSQESVFGSTSSTTLKQFDPAKGILISAKAETSGYATFTLKDTPPPISKPTSYSFKVGYYIYYNNASFHLFLNGGDTLAPYKGDYMLVAKGTGLETVTGKGLELFKGKGELKLSFSADAPSPPPPDGSSTLNPTSYKGSVRITYRYYPSLTKPPTKLPDQPFLPKKDPKLPK